MKESETLTMENAMLKIVTNNVPRDVLSGYEMDPQILRDVFDIEIQDMNDDQIGDLCSMQFVKFRGMWYDVSDFITTSPGPWNHGLPEEFRQWDGYSSDSFFSGVLLKYVREDDRMDFDRVVMATYYS
jgi:hypothetical protein